MELQPRETDVIENREPAITETLRMEGGGQYTNKPTDRGGATRWGVTHKTLALARGVESVTPEEVMDLTEEEAKQVYRTLFWNAINGDKLPSTQVAASRWPRCFARNLSATPTSSRAAQVAQ